MDSVEEEYKLGHFDHTFLVFATDNKVVEAALYKGTAYSPLLLEQIKRFHRLQMQYGFQSVVSHVVGTRQIAQGSDGLSQGALNEGVMNTTFENK